MSPDSGTRRRLDGRFRIRQAALEDLPALAAMKARAWRESYDFDEAVFARQDELAAQTAVAWADAARRGGYFWGVIDTHAPEPEGGGHAWVGVAHATVTADPQAPTSLELAMIYLLDVAKGSGIADRLLQMAMGDAPAHLWVLEHNPRALAFYRRHGFEPDGVVADLTGSLAGHREIRLVRG
ncbi:GNAT family N-acetyltransferase [Aestuariimicrobium soli]|uniref:GNAT family N-acetyltransferase n=1 Tax=Aestuariimicrobium soli TaxID=2035834 RepID=UPI003EBC7D9A